MERQCDLPKGCSEARKSPGALTSYLHAALCGGGGGVASSLGTSTLHRLYQQAIPLDSNGLVPGYQRSRPCPLACRLEIWWWDEQQLPWLQEPQQ